MQYVIKTIHVEKRRGLWRASCVLNPTTKVYTATWDDDRLTAVGGLAEGVLRLRKYGKDFVLANSVGIDTNSGI